VEVYCLGSLVCHLKFGLWLQNRYVLLNMAGSWMSRNLAKGFTTFASIGISAQSLMVATFGLVDWNIDISQF